MLSMNPPDRKRRRRFVLCKPIKQGPAKIFKICPCLDIDCGPINNHRNSSLDLDVHTSHEEHHKRLSKHDLQNHHRYRRRPWNRAGYLPVFIEEVPQSSARVTYTERARGAQEAIPLTGRVLGCRLDGVPGESTRQIKIYLETVILKYLHQNATKITDLAVKFGGQIDGVIINHAALEPIKKVADSSVEEWKKLYDINLFSPLALVSPNQKHDEPDET